MSQLAYLVIREGTKWSDVFRLVPEYGPGRPRADEPDRHQRRACSRTHVEVFQSGGQWTLPRSRQPQRHDGRRPAVQGDWTLKPGDVIRIGHTQLVFVYKLTEAFSDASNLLRRGPPDTAKAEDAAAEDDSSVLKPPEPTTITHRRGKTKFLAPGEEEQEESGVSKIGRAAAKLCRLAFELAKAPDVASLAEMALKGLDEGTQTDAGAVLLVPRNFQGEAHGDDLEIIASKRPPNTSTIAYPTFSPQR